MSKSKYFEILELKEDGVVHLRNDKIKRARFKVYVQFVLGCFDNREFLIRFRYVPELKRKFVIY